MVDRWSTSRWIRISPGVDAMIQAIESDPKIKMVFLIIRTTRPVVGWGRLDGEFIQRLPPEIVFILDEAYKSSFEPRTKRTVSPYARPVLGP